MRKFKTQSEYINSFPLPVRVMLNEMRRVILEEAPSAEQSISYGMAAFKIKRPLVYIAGFKNHVSFFPTSSGVEAFRSQLAKYKTSKGTIQFQIGEKLPLSLLRRIVRFRLKETQNKMGRASSCDKKALAEFDYSSLDDELRTLSKPAQRALLNAGLFKKRTALAKSDEYLLSLHGFGPNALRALREHKT
jgi:uncharacterized protein YdhG (YjbR/CyaY superfamily)